MGRLKFPARYYSNGVGASGSYLIDAGRKFLHLFLGHTGDELSAFSSDFAIVSGPIGRSVIGKLSKCTRKVCKLFLSIKHTSRLEDKICKHYSKCINYIHLLKMMRKGVCT